MRRIMTRGGWRSFKRRFAITGKAPTKTPTRAFSWLKAAPTASRLKHYSKQALTPW